MQLTFRAQMFLPPRELVTLEYLKGIFAGRVKVLHNFEICPVKVPYAHTITKKLVAEKVKDADGIKEYLPKDPLKMTSKQWLFTVVATLDPEFFPRLVVEVKNQKAVKKAKPQKTIEVTDEMLKLIERFQSFSLRETNSRSLAGLAAGRSGRKKSREQWRQELDFDTRFEAKYDRAQASRTALALFEQGPVRRAFSTK